MCSITIASRARREIILGFLVCSVFFAVVTCAGQDEPEEQDLMARARVFMDAGPGLRAIHRGRDGKYYILSAPANVVAVYSPDGNRIGQIPKKPAKKSGIESGADFDVDSSGRLYVADRGANAIKIYSSEGVLTSSFTVDAPISVAALPKGEIAVTSEHSSQLIEIFDQDGKKLRDFGEPVDISDRPELNRYVNIGRILADGDELFYAFTYFPEPKVGDYDDSGKLASEISLTAIDYLPRAHAVRREIARQEDLSTPPLLKPTINAFGVDSSGEFWIAMGDELVRIDKDGNRRADYRTYTSEGERVQPVSILVESNRILLAADPIGVYDFARPPHSGSESTTPSAPAH